jgi:natural product precursor
MKKMKKTEFTEKFKKEMIERKQMNYLLGGDGDGAQGGTGDPWP